jgi:hypothetical protein
LELTEPVASRPRGPVRLVPVVTPVLDVIDLSGATPGPGAGAVRPFVPHVSQ